MFGLFLNVIIYQTNKICVSSLFYQTIPDMLGYKEGSLISYQ